MLDDLVHLPPVGQSRDASVIDEVVGLDLPAEMIVVVDFLFRVVTVDGPEVYTSLVAPVYGLLQGLSLAHAP